MVPLQNETSVNTVKMIYMPRRDGRTNHVMTTNLRAAEVGSTMTTKHHPPRNFRKATAKDLHRFLLML
jgi:hypothetical protein